MTAKADALYAEGQELAKAGKYNEACKAFEASLRLDPSDATLFNLADCEEHRGHWTSAVKRWKEALANPDITAEDKGAVTGRLTAAEKHVANLKLRMAPALPAGTTVTLDGQPISPEDMAGPIMVDPGDHKITVTSPGREPREVSISPKAGESPEVPLTPGKEIVAPPKPPIEKAPVSPEKAPPRAVTFSSALGISRHYLSYSSLLAGAGFGVGVGLVAKDLLAAYHVFAPKCMLKPSPCPDSEFEDIRARERNVNILVAGVVVFGVLAPILYFTVEGGPFERPKTSALPPPKVGVGIGPGTATLDVRF